jgi:hypothetical protein
MATSADKGAVRDVTQIQRANDAGGLARVLLAAILIAVTPGPGLSSA